jgi:hypothetical protein
MANDKVLPIKPNEVAEYQKKNLPNAVIETFNELIASKFVNGSATVKQSDVIKLMLKKGLNKDDIEEKGWLNVEEVYRLDGWKVNYKKPGFNETRDAVFEFSI